MFAIKSWQIFNKLTNWSIFTGEIIGKRYDFAITGFSVTNERKADANFFNLPELRDMRTLLVRRPTTATITFHAYIKQFSNWLWICTIGTALANIVVIWIALMGKKHWNKELKLSDWPSQEYYPIEAVYMGNTSKILFKAFCHTNFQQCNNYKIKKQLCLEPMSLHSN